MKKTFVLFALAFLLVGFSQAFAQTPDMMDIWWTYSKVEFAGSDQSVGKAMFEKIKSNIGGTPYKLKFEKNPHFDFQLVYEHSNGLYTTTGGGLKKIEGDKYAFDFLSDEPVIMSIKLSKDKQLLHLIAYSDGGEFVAMTFEKE